MREYGKDRPLARASERVALRSLLPDQRQVIQELLEYFEEEDEASLIEGIQTRRFEHQLACHWLPVPKGPAFLESTVRSVFLWPYRLWKWSYRNYPTEGSLARRLPLRTLIALTKPVAVWLGTRRRFPSDEALAEMYRDVDSKATIVTGMQFSYHGERAGLILDTLHGELETKPGMKVLDFGCGVAAFSLILARQGCDVTLLDVEGEVSDFARWRFEREALLYNFLPHDASLEDSSYDAILCLDVLEHLRQPVAVFQSLHRALVPGGLMVLTWPSEWGHGYGHIKEAADNWSAERGDAFIKQHFDLVSSYSTYFGVYRKRDISPARRPA